MEVLPIFSSHYSIGDSILTVDEYDDKDPIIKDTKPVNIFAIAKQYSMERVILCESEMAGFWEVYKTSKSKKIPFVFGVKLAICEDATQYDKESKKTESNVIVFFNNTQGYYDFLKIFNKASTTWYYEGRRVDWRTLNNFMTDNLTVAIPFYSSFLARNNLKFEYRCLPSFVKFRPTFFINRHNLPFDDVLERQVLKYTQANGYDIQEIHQVSYYKDHDSIALQVLQCLKNRGDAKSQGRPPSLREPNLNHFGSDQFSFESYLRKVGREIIL